MINADGYAGLVRTLNILPNSSLSQCSEAGHHRVNSRPWSRIDHVFHATRTDAVALHGLSLVLRPRPSFDGYSIPYIL
jgi:hypothetical protein